MKQLIRGLLMRNRVAASTIHGDHHHADVSKSILEVNIISVQSLPQIARSKKIQIYAVAYIDPNKKLTSRRIDVTPEDSIPTWNDKLIFFIDKNLVLERPGACLVVEIYRARSKKKNKGKDKKIGVAQVLVQDLLAKSCGPIKGMAIHMNTGYDKLNKSLFPIFNNHRTDDSQSDDEAILNIGVDTSFSSFYNSLGSEHHHYHSSCMDYRELMMGY